MRRQRFAIGIGLGTLLMIGLASAALDVKSRHDEALVGHTLQVLQQASELRVLLRQAESSARGYVLTSSDSFMKEFRDTDGKIPAAFAQLLQQVNDNPEQTERLKAIQERTTFRLSRLQELIHLHEISDQAGVAALTARAEGRTAMTAVSQQLDAFTAEEKRLLALRSATSRATGSLLLAIDLAGIAAVLLIAAYLIRRTYRSATALRKSLQHTQATASSLEAQALSQRDDLVAAYEKLQHSSAVLETTFNTMAEGVLVVAPDGMVALSNPTAERIFHLEPGKRLADIKFEHRFHEADGVTPIAEAELPTSRALDGLPFDRREVVVRSADGVASFRLLVSGRTLRDAAGRISGAAMVYHDITEVHETERLLQQAQKLDAIGKLTGGVAHDFNNMLTVITGAIDALLDQLQDRPSSAEIAGMISRAADRCTELIRHLLAFARKQPLRPMDTDINSTVLDITKLLRPTLGEQIQVSTILTDETLIAHIDSAQLANSLVNMAINARDAMPDGGKLLIETKKVALDDAYSAANPGVAAGSYILIAVSDTGSGMPAAVRDRAFEPFFTTKPAGSGSGLGLSMVYGFVKQSGGHIKIYSEEGCGTTIRLYLPPADAAAWMEPAEDAPLPRGAETILVVEDDVLVRDFVLAQLQGLGYHTIAATTGAEALAIINANQPFDLLFTDVIMPGGLNGRELAEAARRLHPAVRVLYTSGYTDNAALEQGELDARALLLTKPYRRAELAQMIRQALSSAAAVPMPAAPSAALPAEQARAT